MPGGEGIGVQKTSGAFKPLWNFWAKKPLEAKNSLGDGFGGTLEKGKGIEGG